MIGAEGFSPEKVTTEFFRFITPALSSGGTAHGMGERQEPGSLSATTGPARKKKRKKTE